jgi:hypothetical protein
MSLPSVGVAGLAPEESSEFDGQKVTDFGCVSTPHWTCAAQILNLGSGGVSPYHFSETARFAEQQFLLKYSRALARGVLLKNSLSVPVIAEDSSRFRKIGEKRRRIPHVDLYTIFLLRRPPEFR